jgi:hypothetical protein
MNISTKKLDNILIGGNKGYGPIKVKILLIQLRIGLSIALLGLFCLAQNFLLHFGQNPTKIFKKTFPARNSFI